MTRLYFLEHWVWLLYDVPWQKGETGLMKLENKAGVTLVVFPRTA